jgi:hypothetical protein
VGVQGATWAQQVLDWRLLPSCPQLQLIDARFGGEPGQQLQLWCMATAFRVISTLDTLGALQTHIPK